MRNVVGMKLGKRSGTGLGTSGWSSGRIENRTILFLAVSWDEIIFYKRQPPGIFDALTERKKQSLMPIPCPWKQRLAPRRNDLY